MPIPQLTKYGLLPEGDHFCTIVEISNDFEGIPDKDRRKRLFNELNSFLGDLRGLNIAVELIVNGSFTSTKVWPKDVDVFVVLKNGVSILDAFRALNTVLIPTGKGRRRIPFGYPHMQLFVGGRRSKAYNNIPRRYRDIRGDDKTKKGVLIITI